LRRGARREAQTEGIERSFVARLEAAIAAIEAGDVATACAKPGDFISHTEAQAGNKLAPEQAFQMIAEAQAVRAALGCP
jgi:proline racemase